MTYSTLFSQFLETNEDLLITMFNLYIQPVNEELTFMDFCEFAFAQQ